MSKVISFRVDSLNYNHLERVYNQCIANAAARGDKIQESLLTSMSISTFAKIVFYTGLDYVATDLNRGATTTPPMGAK